MPDGNQAVNAWRETEVNGAEILVVEVLVDNSQFLVNLEDGERNFLANFLDLIALGEAKGDVLVFRFLTVACLFGSKLFALTSHQADGKHRIEFDRFHICIFIIVCNIQVAKI